VELQTSQNNWISIVHGHGDIQNQTGNLMHANLKEGKARQSIRDNHLGNSTTG